MPGVAPHNWQAGVTPTLSLSHKGQVVGAKVLAASMLDMLTDPGLITKAKQEFDAVLQKSPYFSLLPPEAKPDLTMNKEVDGPPAARDEQALPEQEGQLQVAMARHDESAACFHL